MLFRSVSQSRYEASLYDDNCFITLTFNDESLTKWWERSISLEDFPLARRVSLCKSDFQNFMKRLRKRFNVPAPGIRFFHCGEYGVENGRPHHHACLFNFRPPDLVFVGDGKKKVLHSDMMQELWPYG